MTENDRNLIAETVEALMGLPEKARQYVLGFAAGIVYQRPQNTDETAE